MFYQTVDLSVTVALSTHAKSCLSTVLLLLSHVLCLHVLYIGPWTQTPNIFLSDSFGS